MSAPPSGSPAGIERVGGALLIQAKTDIRNCIFEQNSGYRGAAVFVGLSNYQADEANLISCTFRNNYGISEGAVHLSGAKKSIIEQCLFYENLSENLGAGLTIGNTNATISACHFKENSAENGAGVMVFQNSESTLDSSSLRIINCLFDLNTVSREGGGIAFNNFTLNSKLEVDSSSFTGNSAISSNGEGGAISVLNYDSNGNGTQLFSIKISNSNFENNEGNYSSAVQIDTNVDSIDLEFDNCYFEGNNSLISGAVNIYSFPSGGSVNARILNSKFTNNISGSYGAGLDFLDLNQIKPTKYLIEDCVFSQNQSEETAGALYFNGDNEGIVKNSVFISNRTGAAGGAVLSFLGSHEFVGCQFIKNETTDDGDFDSGGGAIYINAPAKMKIKSSIFNENSSPFEGAALLSYGNGPKFIEDCLFINHTGNSVIRNTNNLYLSNVSLADNEYGLSLESNSTTQIQNSIFSNISGNLDYEQNLFIISKGGNISSDDSMNDFLGGYNEYLDLHSTDPKLDQDYKPTITSPAINFGNPEGITSEFDLAGEARIQGGQIDAGAFESSFVTSTIKGTKEEESIHLWPNPTTSLINITTNQKIDLIKVYGVDCKLMQTFSSSNQIRLDPNLTPGVYRIEFITFKKEKLSRLVRKL